jgi:hypothetical protein
MAWYNPLDDDFALNKVPVVGDIYHGAQGIVNDALGRGGGTPPGGISPAEWAAQRDRMAGRYDAAGHRIDDVYGQIALDRANAQGWQGSAPIRDTTPVTRERVAYRDVTRADQWTRL